MQFEQTADSDTVSTYQVSSVQFLLVTDCTEDSNRLKQCHCLQFAQIALLSFDI